MHEDYSILIKEISKRYKLYDSIADQALDVLGLARYRFWKELKFTEYPALDNISLSIKKGERIGIVGRNGAGKTTLLKLITGNFQPTDGEIIVNGKIQALMNVGLGFHPEFTGYENIRSSLAYNGLMQSELDKAVDDVVDFVELEDYLHQPMKSYSMGMQARLMFATATAIRPDILIVDEVLGAGDAYFSAKSAVRMERLASSGCTLLLVSHSMQQVLQFCDRAIWIENGKSVMEGKSIDVVKAYEEFTESLKQPSNEIEKKNNKTVVDQKWFREKMLEETLLNANDAPHDEVIKNDNKLKISRWPAEHGLKISGVKVLNKENEENFNFHTGDYMKIQIAILAEETGKYNCQYVILLFSEDGKELVRHLSDVDEFDIIQGETRVKELIYPEIMLGNGDYIFSAAIYKHYDSDTPAKSLRYDLLSRSFSFKVANPRKNDPTLFNHPSIWL